MYKTSFCFKHCLKNRTTIFDASGWLIHGTTQRQPGTKFVKLTALYIILSSNGKSNHNRYVMIYPIHFPQRRPDWRHNFLLLHSYNILGYVGKILSQHHVANDSDRLESGENFTVLNINACLQAILVDLTKTLSCIIRFQDQTKGKTTLAQSGAKSYDRLGNCVLSLRNYEAT